MDRLRLGLLLVLAAALAWIAYALVQGIDGVLFDIALLGAGAAVAAWAVGAARPRVAGAGLVLVAVATALFYDGSFTGGLAPIAGAVFALGCAIAGAAWLLARPRVAPVGAFVACAGAVLWVFADGFDGLGWQPGNLLAVAGTALVGLDAREGP